MKEILILCTSWAEDYWETDKIAPYPKTSIKPVKHLKKALPVPAIGVYIKQRERDLTSLSPCFLIVRNIRENEGGEPLFDFHFAAKVEGLTSMRFLSEIGGKRLFYTVPQERVLKALSRFGIEPPPEWKMLLEAKAKPSWLDWVGRHFKEVLKPISNLQYEDRVAEIFNSLGFEVEQMGYKREGEYPDGIIYSKDFAVVYDCKNRSNYFLDAKDKRAMIRYVQYAKRRIEEQKGIERVYFAFIAHSHREALKNLSSVEKGTSTKGTLFTSETLLYLLYKRLCLGPRFLLVDFEELISGQLVTQETIDKVYGDKL